MVTYLRQHGVDIDFQLLTINKSHELANFIAENHYDLLVTKNDRIQLKTQDNWSFISSKKSDLLHDFDISTLYVSDRSWQQQGHILAALETEELTGKYQSMNHDIMEKNQAIAELLRSDVHLLNCYHENCNISFETEEKIKGILNLYHQHFLHLSEAAHEFHIEDTKLHIEQGLPDDIIPEQAMKLETNMVVMGSGEHHGLLSSLKGHTLDYALAELSCDLLALKGNNNYCH